MNDRSYEDFERARSRGFWRRLQSWLTGGDNELLPFEEVRRRLPIRGQRHVGLEQVPIDAIVGSVGRYRDFDRAFFPTQSGTRDRWVAISRARYRDVPLPPVDLYRLGEVYFVRDGNHRVSVARDRGQEFVDAHVVEIDVPVALGKDTGLDDLTLAEERARFLDKTRLGELRPDVAIESRRPGQYERLLEHVSAHRWFTSQRLDREVSWDEAVTSWLDEIYLPMVALVRGQRLLEDFDGATEADLYLWIHDVQDFLRTAQRELGGAGRGAATRLPRPIRRLARVLRRPELRRHLLELRYGLFLEQTGLAERRPGADLRSTLSHAYEDLSEHISRHRWYLGEQRGAQVPYADAVVSWYDHVYLPLVRWIREQGILETMPERTATDLYLWIQERRERLGGEPEADAPFSE